ncbi:MAG: IS91 family transposase, partial [Planctomycetota bacterium]
MPARDDYLVPVRALSRLFRGIFLDSLRRQFKDIDLPKSLGQKDWVVYCKPAVQGTGTVLNYLARYIHRVAITNSRIISADDGKVTFTFRYKDSGGAQTKTMTVGAEEFIRRFLQHVLPAGVHKVRYYGLWSPSYRQNLSQVQQILTQSGDDQQVQIEEDIAPEVSLSSETRKCRHCQKGTLIWIRRLPRQGRAPP